MTITDFTYLLENPHKVKDPLQIKQLEDIIDEYPYFQAARSLHLKGLKNLNSYKYNKTLKITAAYTTDRDVLFNFITSKDFLHYNKKNSVSDTVTAQEAKTFDKVEQKPVLIEESEDKPLPQDKEDAEQILDPELFKSKAPLKEVKETLELGQPLTFDKKEKYSFTEWLQLASKKPIERGEKNVKDSTENKRAPLKSIVQKQNFDRIDKFIAQNPKIVPKASPQSTIDVKSSIKLDKNELMTETLARVYLEQKKYKKAIQAYKILSLKYPEKSGFFADRIKAVEKIQQENK
ncbi:hypothetical protein ACOCEA_17045 [Maribacter sp. CXY002]|uniref:hypothetical protein n=1 Tax=Maribacter luteocoastalis TaxID=3407671 RepID=UPI003B67D136